MSPHRYYFVTDVETDGPVPEENSLLSFATVCVRDDGNLCGEFEAVLKPEANKSPDEKTMAWWRTQPEAWAAATVKPENPETVMQRFADWVEEYEGERFFAARPLIFDGAWIDAYLWRYVKSRIIRFPYSGRQIFDGAGLDIPSFMTGVFANLNHLSGRYPIPSDWLGNHNHTHRAIDDARGYAELLSRLLDIANKSGVHPNDYQDGVA